MTNIGEQIYKEVKEMAQRLGKPGAVHTWRAIRYGGAMRAEESKVDYMKLMPDGETLDLGIYQKGEE